MDVLLETGERGLGSEQRLCVLDPCIVVHNTTSLLGVQCVLIVLGLDLQSPFLEFFFLVI